MALSDLGARNAKPKAQKYKLSDAHGLYLTVLPSGAKAWKMAYRFGGKQRELTIGSYPLVGLAQARAKRDEARKLLEKGEDPGIRKRLDRLATAEVSATTFKLIGDEWIKRAEDERERALKVAQETGQRYTGKSELTIEKRRWLLTLANPKLGHRPISQIKPIEVLEVLQTIERTGRLETARRLRSTISRVFRYAIVTARAEIDPSAPLVGATQPPVVKHHAAITDPKLVGPLMRAIDGYQGRGRTVRVALELLARVFVRSSELRFAAWPEFDLDGALWSIPPERMKMDLPHLVPLSWQSVKLLRTWREESVGDLVFPGERSIRRPISENTINGALRIMGYEKVDMTGHGFRTMASTTLHEQGWDSDWVERQLAHKDKNEIRAAYNAAEYLDGRRQMMQAWSDFLDREAAPIDDEDLIG